MPEVTGTRSHLGLRSRECPSFVNLQTVSPPQVGRGCGARFAPGAVGSAWGPALGKVWEFIRKPARPADSMATTFFSTTTRHSRARRYCATSVSRSRAHLKLRARCTRPKRKGARLAVAVHRGPVQSHERGARRDQKMDGGESEEVRWALVGDIRRSDAGSGDT